MRRGPVGRSGRGGRVGTTGWDEETIGRQLLEQALHIREHTVGRDPEALAEAAGQLRHVPVGIELGPDRPRRGVEHVQASVTDVEEHGGTPHLPDEHPAIRLEGDGRPGIHVALSGSAASRTRRWRTRWRAVGRAITTNSSGRVIDR